jgi:uncharacterized protein (DUF4415 family)
MHEEDFANLKQAMAEVKAYRAGDKGNTVTHTPEEIEARRGRGRPVGTVKPDSKQQISIRLDPEVIAHFRRTGPGWQARVNDVLKAAMRG